MSEALAIPEAAAPVAVELDPRSTALIVMDITDPLCTGLPRCVAAVPRIADLLARARAADATVAHTIGRKPTRFIDEVAPRADEPVFQARADKFHGSGMDEWLRAHGVSTLLLVGTAANGAVMYTSFSACVRGYTVAVAADAISAADEATERFVHWQLLNQPGFTNAQNRPLAEDRVTLTTTALASFG